MILRYFLRKNEKNFAENAKKHVILPQNDIEKHENRRFCGGFLFFALRNGGFCKLFTQFVLKIDDCPKSIAKL